jgi:DNA-binding MltR family transcriptional regulator
MTGNALTPEELKRRALILFNSLARESNRGAVLTGAAHLDQMLELLLRARFSAVRQKPSRAINPLFEGFGPLATFSGKVAVAYAIDLLEDWMYQDLHSIRKLRNLFAHTTAIIEFDSPEVVDLTSQLTAKGLRKEDFDLSNVIGKERLQFQSALVHIAALIASKIVVQLSNVPDDFKAQFMVALE